MGIDEKNEGNAKGIKKKLCRGGMFVLIAIAITILCFLGKDWLVRKHADETYESLQQNVAVISEETEAVAGTMETQAVKEETTEEVVEIPDEEREPVDLLSLRGIEIPEMEIDWDELTETDENIYAWLYVPETNINYPLLQHPTEESYYLTHNLDGSEGRPGCLYTQYYNAKDFMDPMTVIYGHNMRNQTMFGTLHKFEEESFFKENRFFYVYTKDKTYVYEVFAAVEFSDAHLLKSFDYSTPECVDIFLGGIKTMGGRLDLVNEEIPVSGINHILTLSTCIRDISNGRYLVMAMLVNDDSLTYVDQKNMYPELFTE